MTGDLLDFSLDSTNTQMFDGVNYADNKAREAEIERLRNLALLNSVRWCPRVHHTTTCHSHPLRVLRVRLVLVFHALVWCVGSRFLRTWANVNARPLCVASTLRSCTATAKSSRRSAFHAWSSGSSLTSMPSIAATSESCPMPVAWRAFEKHLTAPKSHLPSRCAWLDCHGGRVAHVHCGLVALALLCCAVLCCAVLCCARLTASRLLCGGCAIPGGACACVCVRVCVCACVFFPAAISCRAHRAP